MRTEGVWRAARAGALAGLTCVAAMEAVARLTGLETLPALLQDPLRAEAMGKAGRARAERLFSWPRLASRLQAWLRGAAG